MKFAKFLIKDLKRSKSRLGKKKPKKVKTQRTSKKEKRN